MDDSARNLNVIGARCMAIAGTSFKRVDRLDLPAIEAHLRRIGRAIGGRRTVIVGRRL
jgi:hypothetical protein